MKNHNQPLFFGYAIAEAAALTGYPYVTVWRHAKGKRKISPDAAKKYNKLLGIPKSELRPDLWETS